MGSGRDDGKAAGCSKPPAAIICERLQQMRCWRLVLSGRLLSAWRAVGLHSGGTRSGARLAACVVRPSLSRRAAVGAIDKGSRDVQRVSGVAERTQIREGSQEVPGRSRGAAGKRAGTSAIRVATARAVADLWSASIWGLAAPLCARHDTLAGEQTPDRGRLASSDDFISRPQRCAGRPAASWRCGGRGLRSPGRATTPCGSAGPVDMPHKFCVLARILPPLPCDVLASSDTHFVATANHGRGGGHNTTHMRDG